MCTLQHSTHSLSKPPRSRQHFSAVSEATCNYGCSPCLCLYFLFPLQDFTPFVFPHWIEVNTGPDRVSEQVDGACGMCASNVARLQMFAAKDRKKSKENLWLGINSSPKPEKCQHQVNYIDLFSTLQSLNNLGWDVDWDTSLIPMYTV